MQRGFGYQNRRNAGFNPATLFAGGINGAWYDPSDATTLFSDRAGTTPCGTPGGGSVVPVGAMLDKRAAGYSVYFDGTGDYLNSAASSDVAFGTGDFTVEFWMYSGDVSGTTQRGMVQTSDTAGGLKTTYTTGIAIGQGAGVSGGALNGGLWANVGGVGLLSNTPVLSTNTWYHIALVRSGTTATLYFNGSAHASATATGNLTGQFAAIGGYYSTSFLFNGYLSNIRIVKGTAVYTGNFTPSGPLSPITGTSLLTCGTSWTGNPAITKNGDARVDGLNPFTASPVGNHAIAANDTTARPELRARVNLLERSEEFDNAYWTSSQGTIAANAGVAPNGTTTADLLTPTSTGTFRQRYRVFAASAISYSLSVYAKASGKTGLMFTDFPGTIAGAQFDLSAGTVTSTASGYTATIQAVGDGWYRCVMTATPTAGATRYAGICVTDNGGTTTGTLDGTNGILIWGAQLTATNEFPANTYQRISDANTYDAVGFPRYLACNGTSSAMSTPGNVNLSGTDKVTVFAGVRKNTDPPDAMLTEFSAVFTNAGSFAVAAPWTSTTLRSYFVAVRGSAINSRSYTGYPAPISNVLTASITTSAADSDAAQDVRINAVDVAGSSIQSGASTGNFGTYPLFIGSRNNASLFFNGNIYSLLVVGSAVSAGQISATEQWVAQRTGITI